LDGKCRELILQSVVSQVTVKLDSIKNCQVFDFQGMIAQTDLQASIPPSTIPLFSMTPLPNLPLPLSTKPLDLIEFGKVEKQSKSNIYIAL
jgi:hypothetical protein